MQFINHRRAIVKALLALPLVGLASPHRASGSSDQLPRLIIGAPSDKAFEELFARQSEWRSARQFVGGVIHADHSLQAINDAQLSLWISELHSTGMQLELEVGVIKRWSTTGEGTFQIERKFWDRVIALGGTIASIAMDEPLNATRQVLRQSDAYAVEQTARFVALVREHYPKMRVGDIETYPTIAAQDHERWIKSLQDRLSALSVRGLDFYRIDPDWVEFDILRNGSWRDLLTVQQYCNRIHLPFSLIYWASGYPKLASMHIADDETWFTRLMAEGYAYASVGGSPDQYVIQSWVDSPIQSLPDSTDFSFTGSIRDFAKKFVVGPNLSR